MNPLSRIGSVVLLGVLGLVVGCSSRPTGPMSVPLTFRPTDQLDIGAAKGVMTKSVSIVVEEGARSADIETHTKTSRIRLHRAELGPDGNFASPDEWLSMTGEPGHQGLCDREQAFVHQAITEDLDLTRHMDDAVASLRICLAADESVRTGKTVRL